MIYRRSSEKHSRRDLMDEAIIQRILHLAEVEKLSQRQIARTLGINRKCVRKILGGINKW
jgi:predicted XRE-type DNA-binding protein